MTRASLGMTTHSRSGFCEAILHCLRLVPDGLATLGPPCGSFTFMNSATSGRTRDTPYGFQKKAYVETASKNLAH